MYTCASPYFYMFSLHRRLAIFCHTHKHKRAWYQTGSACMAECVVVDGCTEEIAVSLIRTLTIIIETLGNFFFSYCTLKHV